MPREMGHGPFFSHPRDAIPCATTETPVTRPPGQRMGGGQGGRGAVPSFRTRTVSRWMTLSPRPTLCRISAISADRSGGASFQNPPSRTTNVILDRDTRFPCWFWVSTSRVTQSFPARSSMAANFPEVVRESPARTGSKNS